MRGKLGPRPTHNTRKHARKTNYKEVRKSRGHEAEGACSRCLSRHPPFKLKASTKCLCRCHSIGEQPLPERQLTKKAPHPQVSKATDKHERRPAPTSALCPLDAEERRRLEGGGRTAFRRSNVEQPQKNTRKKMYIYIYIYCLGLWQPADYLRISLASGLRLAEKFVV